MARNVNSVITKERHKKILNRAKGFYGARSRQYKTAKEAVYHAMSHSTAHRKQRQRMIRRLWITRINAAVRLFDLSYSKFIHGLKKLNIDLDRKVLSHMVINEKENFKDLINSVQQATA